MTNEYKTRPFSLRYRMAVGCAGAGLLVLLITASGLTPDPRGFGTHEQLGLTPCRFYQLTHLVCPTCGATTAWALALRGNIAAAAQANLAGTLSCLASLVCVPWLLASAARGRWIAAVTAKTTLLAGTALMVVAVLDWIRRLLV